MRGDPGRDQPRRCRRRGPGPRHRAQRDEARLHRHRPAARVRRPLRRPSPVAVPDRTQSSGAAEPVLISFATSDELSELEGQVAGVGGSASVQRHGVRTYVTGQVTLDIDTFDDLVDRAAAALDVARAIAMHELGHLVGLAHVDDERELMDAQNHGQLDFGPGDRRGLARLGSGPCA